MISSIKGKNIVIIDHIIVVKKKNINMSPIEVRLTSSLTKILIKGITIRINGFIEFFNTIKPLFFFFYYF